eukprot:EG_transcript_1909
MAHACPSSAAARDAGRPLHCPVTDEHSGCVSPSPSSHRRPSPTIPANSFFTLASTAPPAPSSRIAPGTSASPSDALSPSIRTKQLLNVASPDTEDPPPPPAAETELPSLGRLAQRYWAWLLPPAALLVLAVPGAYFVDGCPWGNAVLFVLVQLLTIGYFLGRVVCHVQSLLQLLEAKADLLYGCDLEQVSSIVSGDERLRYLQLALYHRHASSPLPRLGTCIESGAPDPLHFLTLDLAARAKSEDGHCVVTSTGTILWCNDALATHLGYAPSELVAENVRRLMPPPYSTVHDALMRKYDRESTTKRIVGCTRTVPVVSRMGTHSAVALTVEERVDPTDEANALFLARMVFTRGPTLLSLVKERMWEGTGIVDGCWELKSHPENFLITDAHGDVLLASDRLATLLGWPLGQLEGHNLAVLMSPDTGGVHADYMWRYVRRADAGPKPRWPDSRMVNASRDLYARCRDGRYLRTWVTVHRLDAPSGRPEDCCFLGTLVYMQAPEGQRPRREDASQRSSTPIPGSAGPSHALSHLARKRCTVLMFDLYGLLDLPASDVGSAYEAFLHVVGDACHKHNAQLQAPAGDRVLVTLNVSVPNLAQRTAAATILQHVTEEWGRSGCALATPVYCAAVHAPALCAMYGRTAVMLGEAIDLCACLVRIAAEVHARHGLVDAALYEELQYAYDCRLVNQVVLHPKQPQARCVPVYELFALKEVDENEWMYQIEPHNKVDPLAHWRGCWDHLEGTAWPHLPGRLPPAQPVQDALDCLECHLEDHPTDPTAAWLHQILLQQTRIVESTPPVSFAGKLPYVVQYGSLSGPAPRSPDPPRRPPRRISLQRTQ